MKSWMITQYGSPADSLALRDSETPVPEKDEVLIKVNAAAFNPIDYKILRGDLRMVSKLHFPEPIGFDVSGEVVEKGNNVKNIEWGAQVFSRVAKSGTMAEYVKAKAGHVAHKPSNITHQQAAGIPLAGLTAYQALFDIAALTSGEHVFIPAGSGGVGSLAIQLANAAGAYVATTTSSVNVDWVNGLITGRVIDYTRDDYTLLLKEFDVVFDTLGGEHTLNAFDILKCGGRLVTIAGGVDVHTAKELGLNKLIQWYLAFKLRKITRRARAMNVSYRYKLMNPDGKQLQEIAQLIEEKKVIPVVDSVFPFERAHEALQRVAEGRAKGKVIVHVTG